MTIPRQQVIEASRADSFTWARVLLLAMIMAAPLPFGAVDSWAWAGLSVGSAIVLLIWALGCFHRRVVAVAWTPLYIPVGLLCGLIAAQWLGSLTADPIATREALVKFPAYLLILFLAMNLFAPGTQRLWRRTGWAIAVYAFAMAVFAIVQFFSNPQEIYWTVQPRFGGYIFGPYVNHNHYAGLMEMLIPVAVGLFLTFRKGQVQRYLVAFVVLTAVVSVVLSGSRGGIAAIVVEGAILAFATAVSRMRRHVLFMAVGASVVAIAASVWLLPPEVSQRFTNTIHSPDISYTSRRAVTLDSLRIIRDHPLLGVGAGSFETVYPAYQSFPTDKIFDYAHNDYAQAVAETGVVGGVLVLAAVLCVVGALRLQFVIGLFSERAWIRLGACTGCIGLLVHSWVDFNLHIPANAAWFAFLLGLAQTAFNRKTSSGPLAYSTPVVELSTVTSSVAPIR